MDSKAQLFLKYKNFYMPGHRFYELDWISAIDIDNKEDFNGKSLFRI